ncbi:MAG: hypothetical protein M5U32_17610 [Myxococcota bacterium]|nr:hypothetical protein [Myxococcota bacterium]
MTGSAVGLRCGFRRREFADPGDETPVRDGRAEPVIVIHFEQADEAR